MRPHFILYRLHFVLYTLTQEELEATLAKLRDATAESTRAREPPSTRGPHHSPHHSEGVSAAQIASSSLTIGCLTDDVLLEVRLLGRLDKHAMANGVGRVRYG